MAAITVRELEKEVIVLRQIINGVQMTVDKHYADNRAEFLRLQREIENYFRGVVETHTPTNAPANNRTEPWRLPLEEFVSYREGVKQDWSEGGNARVGKKLAAALKRTSGHAEGQLYMDWCKQVGRAAVKAFWIGRGFDGVPSGL
jgi:hypothetical protein